MFRFIGFCMNYVTVALFFAFMAGMGAHAGSVIGSLVFLAAALIIVICKGNILNIHNELSTLLRRILLNW
jgi:hypothetical protein